MKYSIKKEYTHTQRLVKNVFEKSVTSTSRPKGSQKKCLNCNSTGHNEGSCCKKFPDRALSWWKKEEAGSKPDSKIHRKKDNVTFKLAVIST